MEIPRIMLAAGASGSGKTLITCGLLQTLVNRGMKVASFKCGPDYIDPMFHSRVIGTKSRNLDGALYTAHVKSFTKGIDYDIQVSQKFIGPEDCVLVLDDFLAKGEALKGLMKIVNESGAKLAGCGIVIEKGFQEGGKLLREQGIRVESLAIVSSISGGKVTFAE